jgi:hypothetical protein
MEVSEDTCHFCDGSFAPSCVPIVYCGRLVGLDVTVGGSKLDIGPELSSILLSYHFQTC